MTRRGLRALARGLVGVLLFAQMAVAAYACPALSPDAGMQRMASVEAPMPGCDGMPGAMDPLGMNLCAEHCKFGQQSDQASTLAVPAVLLSMRYTLPTLCEPAAPPRAEVDSPGALAAAWPPHTLLHCVFRI